MHQNELLNWLKVFWQKYPSGDLINKVPMSLPKHYLLIILLVLLLGMRLQLERLEAKEEIHYIKGFSEINEGLMMMLRLTADLLKNLKDCSTRIPKPKRALKEL